MIPFLFSVDNLPFTIAIGVMLAISFLEGIGMTVGISFFGIFEILFSLYGNGDKLQDPAPRSPFGNPWALIQDGKVPAILIIVIFLVTFGLTGLLLQFMAKSFLEDYLPWVVAIWPVLAIALSFASISAMILSRIPFWEVEGSFAVSEGSFIGKVATITLGTAKKGEPAEAKLRDPYGKIHFVMVEPDREGVQFDQSTHVLLVKKQGSIFKGIKNPNMALIPEKDRS